VLSSRIAESERNPVQVSSQERPCTAGDFAEKRSGQRPANNARRAVGALSRLGSYNTGYESSARCLNDPHSTPRQDGAFRHTLRPRR
jgi:hypothetical protein